MKKENPIVLKQRKSVFKNTVFNVFSDHLADEKESLVNDYLVVEPILKNHEGITGVAILPVNNKKIGLIQIYRHAISANAWEVPRGFIDKDETPEVAALRELREETGEICDKSMLTSLGTVCPEPGIISAKVNLYRAAVTEIANSGTECELGHIAFNWFDKDEIKEMIGNKQIIDATSLITIYKGAYS